MIGKNIAATIAPNETQLKNINITKKMMTQPIAAEKLIAKIIIKFIVRNIYVSFRY